jgi:hypothetical protein
MVDKEIEVSKKVSDEIVDLTKDRAGIDIYLSLFYNLIKNITF